MIARNAAYCQGATENNNGVGGPNINSALTHTAETENLDSRGTLQMYDFRIGAPPAETIQADPIPPQGGSDSRTRGADFAGMTGNPPEKGL